MPKRHRAAAVLLAALLTTNGDCTPLIVGRSGHHIFVATNSIDTDGKSRCKLHFAKRAVILWATQATSMTLIWPDGHKETVDFEAAINSRIRDVDEPIDVLQEILVQDAEDRIRAMLQHYKATDLNRTDIASDLVSEYVIVGRERNGFIGVRAFTLEVSDLRSITFKVREITSKLHEGEIIDYSQGEVNTSHAHGQKALLAAIDARLQNDNEVALGFGNKAFSPPIRRDGCHALSSFLSL